MTLVATQNYLKTTLLGVSWPPTMLALPNPPGPLQVFITPPNPNVIASAPTACIWMVRGMENRAGAKYGAGTVPRALVAGGPSGTKAVEHSIPIYIVWEGSNADPNADNLFPGMLDAIRSVLRASTDPEVVTDPWTGEQSYLVDVGETVEYQTDLWAIENQRLDRWDALLTCSVVEVFSA